MGFRWARPPAAYREELSRRLGRKSPLCYNPPPADFFGESVAQLVEHHTFNVAVVGSIPTRLTKKTGFSPAMTIARIEKKR